ncbi:hypothetical protein ONS95_011895 [Cadophora gregata]|uniref:uncharacterized protein n=1 Tax=Cadophora gregata TaxID=51156 RepID=UPI0026DDA076|nr:uncharacterized protein ONS95_011895 [Cadophora gregata]KAK0117558.1 hypothetical protein ONS95_011895 [Cadophora gregata]KAK0122611.1 hypothetical protein ONS96_009651 [Cadophora gregata f. sp. sojae]
MKGTGIHMQDNDSASESSTQHPSLTPRTSGASTPDTLEHEHDRAFDHTTLEEDYFNEHLPQYEAEEQDHPARDQARENDAGSPFCAILPQRLAGWMERESRIKLSPLAAAALIDAAILTPDNLSLYPPRSHTPPPGPTDPISGVLSAAHGTLGGVIMGVADYPIEITKMAKANRDVAAGLATDFALDSGKGVSRIVGTGLKAPMDMTLNISRGFGNLPKLYGDETVRKEERVTGITSGLGAAGKGLGLGLYDGITGLVTQPMNGAKKGGLGGFFAGVGKGLGGVVCKPAAGAVGLTAYTFKGVYEEVQNKRDDFLKSTQLGNGKTESRKCSEEDRLAIIENWYFLVQSAEAREKTRFH